MNENNLFLTMSKRSKINEMETDSIDIISVEKKSKKISWSEKCVELVKFLNEGVVYFLISF